MSVKDLFNGIAVVIDDEINDQTSNITKIINNIESENIPVLKYESIPPEEVIKHFQNLSFLMLDWRLIKSNITEKDIEAGVTIPEGLEEYDGSENINLIKFLNTVCFCPIFIFTNEDIDLIKDRLASEGIITDDKPNNIFIKRKIDLKGRKKFIQLIDKWLSKTPSIYVLKKWEKQYQKSKNSLFFEFQKISPVWVKIIWKNYLSDGVNASNELGELISRNLHTRMTPFRFSEEILQKRGKKIPQEELRSVLEGERFLKSLDPDSIAPGDIFKKSSNYYINIRAACDLIPGRSGGCISNDDIDLYLLKGTKISPSNGKKKFSKKFGLFPENDTQAIVFPIDDGNIIDFRFKKLYLEKWKEVKDKRIGRLLPPHINRIQHRYSHYMQRQGLPRIPDLAI